MAPTALSTNILQSWVAIYIVQHKVLTYYRAGLLYIYIIQHSVVTLITELGCYCIYVMQHSEETLITELGC